MLRTTNLSLRVIVVGLMLSMSLGASALPLSPKWMKSSTEGKKAPEAPGELDTGTGGGGVGGGAQALPLPASIWLFVIGGVGMSLIRRRKR